MGLEQANRLLEWRSSGVSIHATYPGVPDTVVSWWRAYVHQQPVAGYKVSRVTYLCQLHILISAMHLLRE
jgi:hypothetical protein